jgi:4-phytase / acid phosphatase
MSAQRPAYLGERAEQIWAMLRKAMRKLPVVLGLSVLLVNTPDSMPAPQKGSGDAELRFVVVLSRHGVRSPTGDAGQYEAYSRAAWPAWDVPPGNLTQHGYELMRTFGMWDRAQLAKEGLLAATGCADAAQVAIVADSDQRTGETGRALAQGMFPECAPAVRALAEGTPDPLFHPLHAGVGPADPPGDAQALAAAMAQRMGGWAGSLTERYRPQLAAMDRILATCGAAEPGHTRKSLFDVPTGIAPGHNDHSIELRGPINTAASLSEIFLLEYAQGLPRQDVGWGCVDGAMVRSLIALHTAAFDVEQRTPAVARMQASNLLDHIRRALGQAATGTADAEAPDRAGDRALFLVGHDSNLASVAALLNLHWDADGRRDDTPPGSALVFELWKRRGTGEQFVKMYFTTQTLEQMRRDAPLTPHDPPVRVSLTACDTPSPDGCSWSAFSRQIQQSLDPGWVVNSRANR